MYDITNLPKKVKTVEQAVINKHNQTAYIKLLMTVNDGEKDIDIMVEAKIINWEPL